MRLPACHDLESRERVDRHDSERVVVVGRNWVSVTRREQACRASQREERNCQKPTENCHRLVSHSKWNERGQRCSQALHAVTRVRMTRDVALLIQISVYLVQLEHSISAPDKVLVIDDD